MFQNIYPVFEPKRLLKKEMLENMGEETVLSKMLGIFPEACLDCSIRITAMEFCMDVTLRERRQG